MAEPWERTFGKAQTQPDGASSPLKKGNYETLSIGHVARWIERRQRNVSTESGVLKQTPYSFSTRFEGQPGTNPEELIAAAHAGCFSMALSAELGKAGLTPETIRTAAALTMEKLESGWTVTQIHLDVTVKMPNADKGKFEAAANAAKGRLPHLTFAQREDHDGRKAGELDESPGH